MFSENMDKFKLATSDELKFELQQRVAKEKESQKHAELDAIAAKEAGEAAAAAEVIPPVPSLESETAFNKIVCTRGRRH